MLVSGNVPTSFSLVLQGFAFINNSIYSFNIQKKQYIYNIHSSKIKNGKPPNIAVLGFLDHLPFPVHATCLEFWKPFNNITFPQGGPLKSTTYKYRDYFTPINWPQITQEKNSKQPRTQLITAHFPRRLSTKSSTTKDPKITTAKPASPKGRKKSMAFAAVSRESL